LQVKPTGSLDNWKSFSQNLKNISGHHDVFVKFPTGKEGSIHIKSLKFIK